MGGSLPPWLVILTVLLLTIRQQLLPDCPVKGKQPYAGEGRSQLRDGEGGSWQLALQVAQWHPALVISADPQVVSDVEHTITSLPRHQMHGLGGFLGLVFPMISSFLTSSWNLFSKSLKQVYAIHFSS